jgi:hypothetical protein
MTKPAVTFSFCRQYEWHCDRVIEIKAAVVSIRYGICAPLGEALSLLGLLMGSELDTVRLQGRWLEAR